MERERMTKVYVIQVWAFHGGGIQGWRTASRAYRQPYCFRTREAAIAAMQEHFGNLREGVSVRVHEVEATPALLANLAAPPVPNEDSV
jgi:hypothetical protein